MSRVVTDVETDKYSVLDGVFYLHNGFRLFNKLFIILDYKDILENKFLEYGLKYRYKLSKYAVLDLVSDKNYTLKFIILANKPEINFDLFGLIIKNFQSLIVDNGGTDYFTLWKSLRENILL